MDLQIPKSNIAPPSMISETEISGMLADAVSVIELFEKNNKITRRNAANVADVVCPHCGSDNCTAKKIFYRCKSCGADGDVTDLYAALSGLDWEAAREQIITKFAPWLSDRTSTVFSSKIAERRKKINAEGAEDRKSAEETIKKAVSSAPQHNSHKLREVLFEINNYTSSELLELAERYGSCSCNKPSERVTGSKIWSSTELYNPADLTDADKAPIEFLIDGIIPVGITLLYAPPKSKKSFMALQMFESVTNGTEFLGRTTTRCDGVYFDLEGSKRRTGNRTQQMNVKIPSTSYISHSLPATVCDGLADELRAAHKEKPNVRFFIIDTYSSALGNHKPSGNGAYNDDVAIWQPLHRMACEENIAILFVHHTNKQGKFVSNDVMDRISGSTGLGASSDANIFIDTDGGRDNNRANIMVIPRDAETTTIKAKFDCFRWEAEESVDEFNHPIVQWCLKNAEHGATAKLYTYRYIYESVYGIPAEGRVPSQTVLSALTRSVRVKLYEYGVVVSLNEYNGNEGRGIRINKVNGMNDKEE